MSRVLSGGGPAGVAWEIGIIAGLEDGGLLAGDADFIFGTSAGSIVGAQIAATRGSSGAYETRLTALEAHLAIVPPPGTPAGPPPVVAPDASAETRMQAVGAWTLAATSAPEQEWVGSFAPLVGGYSSWPGGYACTAVDTANGELAIWTSRSGIDLTRGTASSCCVPGLFPPVTINERRYMDGGVRSSTNADLATGYERVLIVAVATAEGARSELLWKRLDAEVTLLREAGAQVEIILPDPGSLDALGSNLMDASQARAIAAAGRRQGSAEAERLLGFWS